MKINIIMVDELGDCKVAKTFTQTQIEAIGHDNIDYVVMAIISKLTGEFPEASFYREDEETVYESRRRVYEELFNEYYEYAQEHEEEIGYEDPFEWADEQARYGTEIW